MIKKLLISAICLLASASAHAAYSFKLNPTTGKLDYVGTAGSSGGGGGGSALVVVVDSGIVFNTVSTMNVSRRDFSTAFTGSTFTLMLSSNVARLDGSSETFNLSSVLNLNAPQLYFNGATGFGGGQDFAEFNVSNNNPRYFIIRNNNNAGNANIFLSADGTNSKYIQFGSIGPTWSDANNAQYLQGSGYLSLIGSGRYGIIDRNPLGASQSASYLMYFTSGTVGINTSTQSAVLEIHSTSSWRTELPLLLVSSETGKNLFLVNKSSTWVEIPLYVSSAVMRGTFNTDKQVNITGADLRLGSGHLIMGGTFGNIVANTGQTSFVGIKFGNGNDFTGFQGFQSTVTFIAYDPTVPLQSGEVGRYSTKFWTFFSSFSNTSLVNISSWSAPDSPPIGLLSISSNVIKAIVIPATYDFWSGSFTSRVPIIMSSGTATGTFTAGSFRGDGSQLTGIAGGSFNPVLAQSITGAWNFQSSFTVLNESTFTATMQVASMTVYGTITSTSGIVAGSTSTFNAAIIKKRVVTVTDATSITPDALIMDVLHQINTQGAGTLTINNPTGSSNDGQSLLIRLKCTNAQTLSWGAEFRGGTTALPTSTTGSSKYDYYSFIRNGLDTKWDFTGQAVGF